MVAMSAGYDVAGLIDPIARALKSDRVTELARTLARMASAGAFDDRAFFAPAAGPGYSRRLIWRDPFGRFVVVGMTWGPGQSSPLHDHGGLWGAEFVVAGTLYEVPYRSVGCDGSGRRRFVREPQLIRERGSVGTLIPPLEYHQVGNAGASEARSVHVYGGDLERCTQYVEETGGWWRPQPVALRYDA